MKINSAYKVSFGLLISTFLSFASYGQIDFNKSLECYLDHQTIKENQIKSLIIYADLSDRIIDKGSIYPGKLMEFEFDRNGFQTYILSRIDRTSFRFIEYGRGSNIELKNFDKNNNLTKRYTENYIRSSEVSYEYDSDGRIISIEDIFGNDTIIKIGFEWKKNKMIKVNNINTSEVNKNRINLYDEKGKVIKVSHGSHLVKYHYTQKNDTLNTTVTTFFSDTLVHTEEYSTLTKFDRIISYVKRDYSEKKVIEMNAQIDKNGNATYYYLNDLSGSHTNNEESQSSVYNISNVYNEKNLLIKRMFYFSREDLGSNRLIKIERYFYDTDELPFKFTMGSVIEPDEIGEEESDINDN